MHGYKIYDFSCFFLVLSVTRPRPPLSQVLVSTLNHENSNVYSPKAFETLIHENVTDIVELNLKNVLECARIMPSVGK